MLPPKPKRRKTGLLPFSSLPKQFEGSIEEFTEVKKVLYYIQCSHIWFKFYIQYFSWGLSAEYHVARKTYF